MLFLMTGAEASACIGQQRCLVLEVSLHRLSQPGEAQREFEMAGTHGAQPKRPNDCVVSVDGRMAKAMVLVDEGFDHLGNYTREDRAFRRRGHFSTT